MCSSLYKGITHSVEVERMLYGRESAFVGKYSNSNVLTGPAGTPMAGMEISTTLFGGKEKTLPFGRSCDACVEPLKIWSSTGTDGGIKDTLLIVN